MSIIKHITLQKIVAHDFRYDPRICFLFVCVCVCLCVYDQLLEQELCSSIMLILLAQEFRGHFRLFVTTPNLTISKYNRFCCCCFCI